MQLPTADMMGIAFGLSEFGLSLWKRSGAGAADEDRRSLRVLWAVILGSVAVAILAVHRFPQFDSPVLAILHRVGIVIFATGLILRWYAIVWLGRFFTVNVAIAADHRVVDTGPYRFVRHPSYTGALLAFLGYGIALGNWMSLLAVTVPIAAAFMRRISVEEAALAGALGPEYRDYAARTRRLLPFIY
jgi:protein-S-isoprenylcysteine O-methyltransferase